MDAVFDSVLDAVGGTPLIRLSRLGADLPVPVYAKVEFFNPGGSVKDRAALAMVTEAERSGTLRPAGVIVEGTSGNTGVGLTMVAALRGHRSIVVVPDKTSQEKIALLKAYGAEVVVTPGGVPREHPDHVHNVAERIAEQTPDAWFANQYDNPANPGTHWATTGPEIWAQTEQRVTHFVAGVGTGGTISGAGGYLKQVSFGRVTVIAADPAQSVYSGGDGSPYYVESIGHYLHPRTEDDVWPKSYDTSVVDRFEQIGDRESILTARRLAREEGLLAGGSAGTAVAAALRVAATLAPPSVVVVLLPDSGRSYLSKYFDDDWLRRLGFLEEPTEETTVADIVSTVDSALPTPLPADLTVGAALAIAEATPNGADLRPVVLPRKTNTVEPNIAETLGAISVRALRLRVAEDESLAGKPLSEQPTEQLATVGIGETGRQAAERFQPGQSAAWVLIDGRVTGLLTRDKLGGPGASAAREGQERSDPGTDRR
ncbi:MAG TPA: pyridoxal-phosphate dependent enzyme [Pseudonocardiaceae bacterium]|nr:pyridoxal-phosphate dependent enzyme [Pseudonocardiaceae bacterium]